MTINYNVTGSERKRLADYISGFMGSDKKYLGAPTFAYQIGYLAVSKDGAVSFEDRGYNSDIDTLMTELEGQGFHTEDTIVKPNTAEQEAVPATDENLDKEWPAEAGNGPQRPNMGLTVAIPLDKVQIDNLDRILAAKGSLIKKALGIDALPVEVGENTLSFPWLSELPGPDAAKAYTHLISALCKMSVNQKRITAREKEVGNEKYAFRCFLLRLGFIGAEFKDERKILLHNLSGNSAFKYGQRHTEALQPELAEALADELLVQQVNEG